MTSDKEKKEIRKQYTESHKEQIAKKQRAWNKNNPEKAAAHRKKYYESNKELRKEADKKYYNANKERIIERQKQYYEVKKEDIKLYQCTLRRKDPINALLKHAKGRALKKGIDFNITKESLSLTLPSKCPLLGIPLFIGDGKLCDNSPTIDRIDGNLGYVNGNVWIISYKANRMKNNSTFEEFKMLCDNWEKKQEVNNDSI